MFCTTVIPTIGRSTLKRAVESVLNQQAAGVEFEVVVVNDSGKPLPEEDWQRDPRVRVIQTDHQERCVARNTGAAAARGIYINFLDDDDWLLPGFIANLQPVAGRDPEAVLVYGGALMIGIKTGSRLTLHCGCSGNCFAQMMGGDWVPFGGALIRADAFVKAGKFDTQITFGEDIDLMRRLALEGEFACTQETVVAYEREGESSTNNLAAIATARQQRERPLNDSRWFSRILASASSDYWKGRVVRVLLISVADNLRKGSVVRALGRGIDVARFLAAARPHMTGPEFRKAVSGSHQTRITAVSQSQP